MHAIQICCLTLCIIIQSVACSLRWHRIHEDTYDINSAPMGRRGSAMTFDEHRDNIVIYGGRKGDDTYSDLSRKTFGDTWIYNIRTNEWKEVVYNADSKPPSPRFDMVYGTSERYFYVAMGESYNSETGETTLKSDVHRFNLDLETWEELRKPSKEFTPDLRHGSIGGIYPNASRLYVTLGSRPVSGFWDVNGQPDTVSYDITDNEWYGEFFPMHAYNPTYPHGRVKGSGLMIAPDKLLIYGGCLNPGPCPTGDAWIFDGKSKTWEQLIYCATPKMYASMAMFPTVNNQRRVVLYGGIEKSIYGTGDVDKTAQVLTFDQSSANQVAVLNVNSLSWKLKKVEGEYHPNYRAGATMVTGRLGIYMFGGYSSDPEGAGSDTNEIWYLVGDSDLAPAHSPCSEGFFSLVMLHGIFMVLGWGVFLQWGAFIARYMERNSLLWARLHAVFQLFGYLLSVGGLVCGILIITPISLHFRSVHSIIGLIIMILGLQQPLNGFLRPKRKEAGFKHAGRTCWEWWHKAVGRFTLMLALVNITLGVFIGLTNRLLWALWIAYIGLLILIYIVLECVRNKCSDRAKEYEDMSDGENTDPNKAHDGAALSREPSRNPSNASDFEMKNRNTYENTAMQGD